MKPITAFLASSTSSLALTVARSFNVTLVPAATGFDADNIGFIYGPTAQLVSNDGSAADGGFRTFCMESSPPFNETTHMRTGRSKIAVPIHDIGGRDLIINIASPDSLVRVFDAKDGSKIKSNDKTQLGDWSTACVWRSAVSGESYLFLFGKRIVVQFLVRSNKNIVEILEVQEFSVPIESESCSVFADGRVFLSAENQPLFVFQAEDSSVSPTITTISDDILVHGLATYHAEDGDFLFVAQNDIISVYDTSLKLAGSLALSGITELSIQGGLSISQSSTTLLPYGVFAFAYEGADDSGIAIGSLEGALGAIGVKPNYGYTPQTKPCEGCQSLVSKKCSTNGFALDEKCSCFPGFTGNSCSESSCVDDCSSRGQCTGPNVCKCNDGWTGPSCSIVAVQSKFETDANGGDGDDPAVWIHPTQSEKSRIITTTKSEEGEGFGVYDLRGKLLQHVTAKEPNNVDIIYNFTLGDRKTDLAFAACRGDNTMCLVAINSTGLIEPVLGGFQPLPDDYEPYGSCNYRSQKTGKEYLFVNNKSAQYLQYELSSTANGTLQTKLVRTFQGGSGGQVEGCVADEGAGFLFLGEEPSGIWRYDAEPGGSDNGTQVAKVGDGSGLQADVEGITLVPAKRGSAGYLIVSSQGISSYLVYERAPPHKYVLTFTIIDNKEKGIDRVSNTDGVAAVGNFLNEDFPYGLVVTHDDANELEGGGTAEQASFKLVSLLDILGQSRVAALGY